jgi:hypothetical protein
MHELSFTEMEMVNGGMSDMVEGGMAFIGIGLASMGVGFAVAAGVAAFSAAVCAGFAIYDVASH